MGILDKLVGGSVAQPIQAFGNIVKSVMGDAGEKMSHEQIMAKLAMQPDLAQIELNKVEAGHRSIFVAGWRPFIGWVCGVGLAYAFIIEPILMVVIDDPELVPKAPLAVMMELVLAMLGFGALRTYEKLKGKAK